ncbi:TIGR01458 family HAD-type hydrolase [Caminibacter sp.]
MIKGLLIDIGGVLYNGNEVIEGAIEAISELRKNYKLRFLSNSSRNTPHSIYKKLKNFGFDIEENEIFTALSAAKRFLEFNNSSAFVIATDEAKEFFDNLEGELNYVLICDAYKNFTYDNLNIGFRLLEEGKGFIATNKNRYFKDTDGLSLDAGGFVTCLEYASGKSAKILGKPNCEFFSLAIKDMGLEKSEVLMVGDDIESDILGAKACMIKAVMVKTGKFKESDLLKGKPDFLIDSIKDLPSLLKTLI